MRVLESWKRPRLEATGVTFKKVEMPIFLGPYPESWLFRTERYFEIHKLTDSEKLIVIVISFDGITLAWYRWNDHRRRFVD